jgi:hypothetical protein
MPLNLPTFTPPQLPPYGRADEIKSKFIIAQRPINSLEHMIVHRY